MRCPTLADLPPPPPGKTGWPWTVETPQLPAVRSDGSPWPRISIVTPSYNQGQFIEETIRSVLLQGYPDLEYIVIDGGSTDGAVDIIRKYVPWLTYWVSEPDRGQAHAITKGLVRSTGDIFQFINSDDILLQDALPTVGAAWHPGHTIVGEIIIGESIADAQLNRTKKLTAADIVTGRGRYLQTAVWMPREGVCRTWLNLDLYYCFDWDMIIRFLLGPHVLCGVEKPLVFFRLHPDSKTVSKPKEFVREEMRIMRALLALPLDPPFETACRGALRRVAWHRCVDRIGNDRKLASAARLYQLLVLSARRPRERLDRYALVYVKSLLCMSPRSRDPVYLRAIQRIVWHRCVDRIGNNQNLTAATRLCRLLVLIARRPRKRLGRYALGRMRRLLLMIPQAPRGFAGG
jgi:glycosyltransferase involved in cell wall biosynthesis